MNREERISEELLNAFVDGQLDGSEWAVISSRLERDPALREEVGRLRALKAMLRQAYATPPVTAGSSLRAAPGWAALAAASLLFALAGWFGHAAWNEPPVLDPASAYALRGDWHSLRADWRSLDAARVLVHVSSGGHGALTGVLDEVDDLLREAGAAGRRLEVEIVANGPGLDLLLASDDALARRVASLRKAHPGLGLVACGQTLARRRAQGGPTGLVDGAAVAPSALHRVIERLRAGWIYVRA